MSNTPQDPIQAFEQEKAERIATYPQDADWQKQSRAWLRRAFEQKYMYNFSWMGRPIIQTPVDMMAMQELIWSIKPDLIIETGIAHGGSLIFSASCFISWVTVSSSTSSPLAIIALTFSPSSPPFEAISLKILPILMGVKPYFSAILSIWVVLPEPGKPTISIFIIYLSFQT